MTVITTSPETAYLTKPNIVHPGTSTEKTAALAKAKLDVASVARVTSVTGGAIN